MFKASHIVLFAMTGWCAFLLFWTSQSVHNKEKILTDLQRSSLQEQEYIRVLHSEWDYLNRPERLETLAYKYFTEQNFKTDAEAILTSVDVLEAPVMPLTPMRKPKGVLRFVSASAPMKEIKNEEPSTITKPERQKFDDLVGRLSDEGGQE